MRPARALRRHRRRRWLGRNDGGQSVSQTRPIRADDRPTEQARRVLHVVQTRGRRLRRRHRDDLRLWRQRLQAVPLPDQRTGRAYRDDRPLHPGPHDVRGPGDYLLAGPEPVSGRTRRALSRRERSAARILRRSLQNVREHRHQKRGGGPALGVFGAPGSAAAAFRSSGHLQNADACSPSA